MANSIQDTFEFEDLTAIYRVERKAPSLSIVRRDIYPAMAGLLIKLNQEYSKQISIDPDSLICEGTNQRRKKARQISKEIVEIRMDKICKLALRGAMGALNVIDVLTPEEKDYYSEILEASKKHTNIISRLSTGKKYSSPRIDVTHEPEPEIVPEPVTERETVIPECEPPVIEIPNEPEPEDVPPEEQGYPSENDIEEFPPDEDIEESMDEEDEAFFKDIPPEPQRELPHHAPVKEQKSNDIGSESTEKMDDQMIIIRIIEDLPTFSGPDRDYSLSKEDLVRMPKTMADVLLNRQKAVLIDPTE